MENCKKISFQEITNEMAKILAAKNKVYGNSFDKTLGKWDMAAVGIRLDDKINRIDGMIIDQQWIQNGEGMLDNLFDLAGYSCLAIRYLVNRGLVDQQSIDKYFK